MSFTKTDELEEAFQAKQDALKELKKLITTMSFHILEIDDFKKKDFDKILQDFMELERRIKYIKVNYFR